jgi:hypothetical protein
MATYCCDEATQCFAPTSVPALADCAHLFDCLQGCTSTDAGPACVTGCNNQYALGQVPLGNVTDCQIADGHCAHDCPPVNGL